MDGRFHFNPLSRTAGPFPSFISLIIQTLTDSNSTFLISKARLERHHSGHPGYERGRNAIVASRRCRARDTDPKSFIALPQLFLLGEARGRRYTGVIATYERERRKKNIPESWAPVGGENRRKEARSNRRRKEYTRIRATRERALLLPFFSRLLVVS